MFIILNCKGIAYSVYRAETTSIRWAGVEVPKIDWSENKTPMPMPRNPNPGGFEPSQSLRSPGKP